MYLRWKKNESDLTLFLINNAVFPSGCCLAITVTILSGLKFKHKALVARKNAAALRK